MLRNLSYQIMEASKEFYVFGYGSLVWKNNDFEYEEKVPGYIEGFKRRFYQNSIDHRGTHENPGRVATLIKSTTSDKVYGMGYKIASNKVDEVIAHLDYREKNGYQRFETFFYPINHSTPKATIVYVADESNPSWNPDHDLKSIANQAFHAVGPSGPNITYVYNLCEAMRENFPNEHHEDTHLFELERLLKIMESEGN